MSSMIEKRKKRFDPPCERDEQRRGERAYVYPTRLQRWKNIGCAIGQSVQLEKDMQM